MLSYQSFIALSHLSSAVASAYQSALQRSLVLGSFFLSYFKTGCGAVKECMLGIVCALADMRSDYHRADLGDLMDELAWDAEMGVL